MTKLSKIVSATIVVFYAGPMCWASPQDSMPDPSPSQEPQANKPTDENMVITDPGAPTRQVRETGPSTEYFSYRQMFTLRAGAAAPMDDLDERETILGFSYMFPKFLSPRFEAGADVHNKDDKGHVYGGFRKIYFEKNRVRPSMRMALSHEVHAEEGLATFANNKHYFGRLGGAVDISYNQDWSIRLEVEGLVGLKKQWVEASAGLSRCW